VCFGEGGARGSSGNTKCRGEERHHIQYRQGKLDSCNLHNDKILYFECLFLLFEI